MLIDWFTVVAQIVNFLILVVVLRYLLYKRIIRAIDDRQASIEAEFEKARNQQVEADEQAREYREKQESLEEQKDQIIEKARQDAQETKDKLEQQARRETELRHDRWNQKLREEKEAFLHDLADRAGRQVCSVSQKTLSDLANASLEEQIVYHFLDRLEKLEAQDRDDMKKSLQKEVRAPEVYTSFEMSEKDRGKVKEALAKLGGKQESVRFKIDAELACGIELRAAGRSVSWNIRSYIDALQRDFEASLGEKSEETS